MTTSIDRALPDRRANQYIAWDRIKLDWDAGYRPQVIAEKENRRRDQEGEQRRLTARAITDHASKEHWERPWKSVATFRVLTNPSP